MNPDTSNAIIQRVQQAITQVPDRARRQVLRHRLDLLMLIGASADEYRRVDGTTTHVHLIEWAMLGEHSGGSFVESLIGGDFVTILNAADTYNTKHLAEWGRYLYNRMPFEALRAKAKDWRGLIHLICNQ